MSDTVRHFLLYALGIGILLLAFKVGTDLWKHKDDKTLIKTDTISVVTKEDSIRISNKALIEASSKFATYDILPDGTWVKRKLKPIYIKGDTVYVDSNPVPGIQVAYIDTNMIYLDKEKKTVTEDSVKILFAQAVNAMKVNFKSNLHDGESDSYYKLNLDASLVDGKWKLNVQEDYNLKKKESTITIERQVPVYNRQLRPFWDRFSYGPIVALGWAVFNKSPDMFIGFGVFFDLR